VGNTTYANQRCRCDGCTEAHRKAHREYRARANKQLALDRLHKRWTDPEMAIALDPGLTTREAAQQVGRTLSAIAELRRRLGRHDKEAGADAAEE